MIEVKKLVKKFSNDTVIDNVDAIFEEGKIYGIIGRNGSGKSVFLKILCGFYAPDSGKIIYDGVDINEKNIYPPSTRALIEKPNFLPELTGKENLMLLASIQKVISEKEIDEILKQMYLYEDKDKKYHKYSLGMKQKLGIAQVLMEQPKVIILDEPFNGLDDKSTEIIRKILVEEKKKKKIIILATHIKEDIDTLCDEVYKIDNGKLKKI